MRLVLHERIAVANDIVSRYRKASKSEKTHILDEFLLATGYVRKYAIHILANWNASILLREQGKLVRIKANHTGKKSYPARQRTYDSDFLKALVLMWSIFSFMCGRRLICSLRNLPEEIQKNKHLRFTPEMWEKLRTVSSATVDRLLVSERKKLTIRGISHTKSVRSALMSQIPIRTFSEWADVKTGSVCIDLVGHEGGNAKGDFCFTLNITDVRTGWTEPQAIQNKAQTWTKQALEERLRQFPFPVSEIHSDNGSEFINAHLRKYCHSHKISFTRSRSGKKNDNCYVEQKNFDIIRKLVGYRRYDTQEELKILNQLYRVWSDFVNFFHPSERLLSKTRIGSKIKKKYEPGKTPYQRVLEDKNVGQAYKDALKKKFNRLDPVQMRKSIDAYCETLFQVNQGKNGGI